MDHDGQWLPQPNSPFLNLPSELRLKIYDFTSNNPSLVRNRSSNLGLFLSCRQIKSEMETEDPRHFRAYIRALRSLWTPSGDIFVLEPRTLAELQHLKLIIPISLVYRATSNPFGKPLVLRDVLMPLYRLGIASLTILLRHDREIQGPVSWGSSGQPKSQFLSSITRELLFKPIARNFEKDRRRGFITPKPRFMNVGKVTFVWEHLAVPQGRTVRETVGQDLMKALDIPYVVSYIENDEGVQIERSYASPTGWRKQERVKGYRKFETFERIVT